MMPTVIIIPYVAPMYGSPDTLGLALASIRRHYKDDYEVRVVGQRPEGIEDDDCIRWMDIDKRGSSQHTDMIERIMCALGFREDLYQVDTPDEFILWHDDMFAVNNVTLEDMRKIYAISDSILSAENSDNYYLRDMHATLETLRQNGITYFFNYTTHCPMLYDTWKFVAIVDKFKLDEVPLDFEMLYFNLNCRNPEVLKSDNSWRQMMSDIYKPPLDKPVFIGLSNKFRNTDYLEALKQRINE